jgi:hypothetical protein
MIIKVIFKIHYEQLNLIIMDYVIFIYMYLIFNIFNLH